MAAYIEDSLRHPYQAAELSVVTKDLTNPSISVLNYSRTKIHAKQAETIAKALINNKNLKHLNFNAGRLGPNIAPICQALGRNTNVLQTLELTNTGLNLECLSAIALMLKKNKVLRALYLNDNALVDAKPIGKALAENDTLELLDLSRTKTNIADLLNSKLKLQVLIWGFNVINLEGSQVLGQFLASNISLRKLVLCSNKLQPESIINISEGLASNTTLISLNLEYNNINTLAVAKILEYNNLQELDLSGCKITGAGAIDIFKALADNTSLQKLNLYNNSLDDEAMLELAQALNQNNTLTDLNLSSTNLSDVGLTALATVLEHNTGLQRLNLDSNNITSFGAISLAHTLDQNKILTVIKLVQNKIDNKGATELFKVMKTNTTVIEFKLRFNYVDEKILDAIFYCCKRNKLN